MREAYSASTFRFLSATILTRGPLCSQLLQVERKRTVTNVQPRNGLTGTSKTTRQITRAIRGYFQRDQSVSEDSRFQLQSTIIIQD